jgi:hypothetical protein
MIDCLLTNWIFYVCLLLASMLSIIPFAGNFLNVLNTMIHESGHAIMALITGGGVVNIKLSADTSGAAQTKSKNWLGKVLVSLAGYPVSSITAWFFFWLIKQQMINYVFYVLISLVLINLTLWVRNTFGMIWLLVMGTLTTLIYLYQNISAHYYYSIFCAGIILFQSVYTSITLVIISFKNPAKAGDAKNLKDFTYIPGFIWALLMLFFALYAAFHCLLNLPCIRLSFFNI